MDESKNYPLYCEQTALHVEFEVFGQFPRSDFVTGVIHAGNSFPASPFSPYSAVRQRKQQWKQPFIDSKIHV